MIRYFKTIQPAALFTIPVVALVLWMPFFFVAEREPVRYDSFLLNFIPDLPFFAQWTISVLLVSLGGIYLNQVTNRHEVIFRHSYLPALFYVILMSCHRELIHFHPLLVSNLLVIRALDKTFSLFKNDSPVSAIFDSSFLLAIATLIYFPSFILLFLFLYAIYKLRSFNFREFMIAAVGYAVPFFFLAVYCFWTDTLATSARNFMEKFSIHNVYDGFRPGRELLAQASYISVLVILAMVRLRSNFFRNAIKTRSSQEILFLFFILAVIGLFFLPGLYFYHFTQLAIPFSVFLAYYFISAKRRLWMYEAALWALLGLISMSYF